ncbi:hypothetical protein MMC06_000880 [Schaereria dolodes]|nr:hypothetical protein [Schaereria dolodes]
MFRRKQKRIKDLRDKLYRYRLRLKEKRNELRDGRLSVSELEGDLVSFLQQVQKHGVVPDNSFLKELYTRLQVARDDVGSLQYEYDQAEDEYEMIEAELDDEEDQPAEIVSLGKSDSGDGTESFAPKTLPKSTASSPKSDQPESLYQMYQSRVGDANILLERLQQLWWSHDRAIRISQLRNNLGLELDDSLTEPIEAFNSRRPEIEAELADMEADVMRLRELAVGAGYQISPPTSPKYPRFVLNLRPDSPESKAESPIPTHQSDSALPFLQATFAKTRARINKWILQSLETSRFEHARHRAILRAMSDESMDDERWARFVLAYWKIDELGDKMSSRTGEEAQSDDEMSDDFHGVYPTRYLLHSSKASRVAVDYDQQFPSPVTLHLGPRKSRAVSTPWLPEDAESPERMDMKFHKPPKENGIHRAGQLIKYSRLDVFLSSTASEAVHDYNLQFSNPIRRHTVPKTSTSWVGGSPYNAALELDLHDKYESQSV